MASPVIEPSVPNFPFKINVPASRPTLPIGNSTLPENIMEPSSPWIHFASQGPASPQEFDFGSSSRKEPFPESRASKRNERLSPFPNVISTLQLPMMFKDCASDKPTPNIWANSIKINAGFAVTITICWRLYLEPRRDSINLCHGFHECTKILAVVRGLIERIDPRVHRRLRQNDPAR